MVRWWGGRVVGWYGGGVVGWWGGRSERWSERFQSSVIHRARTVVMMSARTKDLNFLGRGSCRIAGMTVMLFLERMMLFLERMMLFLETVLLFLETVLLFLVT